MQVFLQIYTIICVLLLILDPMLPIRNHKHKNRRGEPTVFVFNQSENGGKLVYRFVEHTHCVRYDLGRREVDSRYLQFVDRIIRSA